MYYIITQCRLVGLVNSVEMNSLDSVMDIDQPKNQEDPFLKFIDYARSALSPEPDENLDPNEKGPETSIGPSWNWIASRILKTCSAYSSGVTAAILLSDISQVPFLIEFVSVWLLRKCEKIKERNLI